MRKICMVVHSYYPNDPRVRREAETLLDMGWMVDVICLRDSDEPAVESHGDGDGTVYRLPVRRHRGSGLAVYLLEYLTFFLMASLRLAWLHLEQGYDVVQVHNMPDFLVFTALFPRLLGARVVLDIHDLVPELYASKFGDSTIHPIVRLTRLIERASTTFADHIITAGEPFRRRLISRGVPADKVTVIMNSADPRLFHAAHATENRAKPDNTFTLIYHGGLFERYGLDIAIRAVARLRKSIPHIRFVIYGQGEARASLQRLIEELDVGEYVRLEGFVPIAAIPARVATADLGVIPYRQNPFTDLLYPTKAFEYIVMGIPVIMARTGAVVELFADMPDMFFAPENVDDLTARILALYGDSERARRLLVLTRQAYAPYSWENQRQGYFLLIDRLVAIHEGIPKPEGS